MRRLYGVLPWGMVVLGLLHMAATFRLYDALTTQALWFFNGGIVIVACGLLNFVNRRHGAAAPSLRRLCQGFNVVTLAFATVSGFVSGGSVTSLIVVLTLFGAVTILSLIRLDPEPHP